MTATATVTAAKPGKKRIMDCHDAEMLLLAEKDGAPSDERRAVLEAHLAGCASCKRLSDDLAAASEHLRASARAVSMPDAGREWREIRARIQAPERSAPAWSKLLPAIAVPLAAAAALAVAFFAEPQWFRRDVAPVEEARAEFVEVIGSDDSPIVFVDEQSGWLVVWAVDPADKVGS